MTTPSKQYNTKSIQGSLKNIWNYVQQEEEEEEEKEDLEIRWMNEVKTGMREKGIDNLEWVDREEWRRKIKLKL